MLKDPPLLTVRRTFQRPPRELIAKLDGAQTGHIVDAMQGRAALDHRIKPVDPECAQFVGPALTCQTGADDNLAILAALVLAEPGDVIVAAADGFSTTAVVGDNVTMMAKNKGVVAIVIDGMARDSYGIVPVGLPVFSRDHAQFVRQERPGQGGIADRMRRRDRSSGRRRAGGPGRRGRDSASTAERVVAHLDEIRRLEEETQKKIRAGMAHLSQHRRPAQVGQSCICRLSGGRFDGA